MLLEQQPNEDRVVFFGDSITELWNLTESFPGRNYVNRGISGQTAPQMLLRFRQDVVALRPRAVILLAGASDIAENTGPETLEEIEGNLASMVEIAQANDIRVILASVLPAAVYPWAKQVNAIEKIATLNTWLKGFAGGRGLIYLDYYAALADDHRGMRAGLSEDGVHPNKTGYAIMQPLAARAIQDALQPLATSR
jgi:lysophospholipase L1-like esterase